MKRWQFWVGLLISLALLYWSLGKLKLTDVVATLESADYLWLLPGILVYMVAVWARAWRWHYLLRPLKKIPTNTMFPIVAIGYMGNNIYPARAGEVLRAIVLKRREGVSISASLATIIVERIFDAVVMLGFVFLNLGELTRVTRGSGSAGIIELGVIGQITIQDLAIGGAVIFLGALAVFILAAMFPLVTERVVNWAIDHLAPERFRQKTRDVSQKFMGGLESLRSPQEALMVLLTSTVIWLLETGKYWFVMHAFHFQVSFFALMLMNGVVNLATTLPSAPGYIGTFDGPGIAVLQLYGVPGPIAAGYTLVLHAALWLPITLLGAYYFLREGYKWGEIPQVEKAS